MDDIFGAFRESREGGSQQSFATLQDRLAANAPRLICSDVVKMKEVIDMLMSLDGAGTTKAEDGAGTEDSIKKFLRGAVEEGDAD